MENEKIKHHLLTAKEVSQFLRIPLSTVYELASKGRIRGVKLGKHWRFLKMDILTLLGLAEARYE